MTFLYKNKFFTVRRATLKDCVILARTLRGADKRELRASHPHTPFAVCLRDFYRQSEICLALELRGKLGALCGIVPASPNAACVWLLTSSRASRYTKSFYRAVQRSLSVALKRYEILFNFADERYTAAHRLVTHLGGKVHGHFIRCGATRFLLFTFRRELMGGIMKLTGSGVSSAVAALDKSRTRRQNGAQEAEGLFAAAERIREAGEQQNAYLFESAAEKTRRLYDAVRAEAAAERTRFSAGGLSASSATLDTLLQQNRLQAQLKHAYEQDLLQAQLSANNQNIEEQVRALREQGTQMRAYSRRSSMFSKWGNVLHSWFH